MSAPSTIKVFFVDPARLASGTWCHERDRQIGEGDIAASYSADRIALEGRVRSPFTWQNCLWVCTGTFSRGDHRTSEAYRLILKRFFEGVPLSFHENAMLGDEARLRPEGFYHGMAVRHGKQHCVLVGPKAVFMASADAQAPSQGDLFDAL